MDDQERINIHYQKLSNAIRILSADAVEKANSGHPGLPLGFADVFTVLTTKFLRYSPKDPKWKGRDRMVLSAGHGSMLLYSFYYLTGFPDYTLECIKNFRQLGSNTHGHPEYDGINPIETTTGPLGQGLANAVGMSIAQKKYEYKLGAIAKWKIYCIVGDGCLMEGITHEAASLAGHLNLNNLIVLFDDNKISIDGPTSLTTSDKHLTKFNALGWEGEEVNGHDYKAIDEALKRAQNSKKPYFIGFNTKIGYGVVGKEGTEKCHGLPLGLEYIHELRKNLGWSNNEPFFVPNSFKKAWENAWKFNEDYYNTWIEEFNKLDLQEQKYFEICQLEFPEFSTQITPEASRASAGRIIEQLLHINKKIIIGSADLSYSNGLYNKFCNPITAEDFSGNFIHYGVRENAMAAIMNGLATQNFLPIGGTFLVFADYMRSSIRLSAIMKLKCLYVMTHDSIGVGEDGPTHQPVEHLASYRAMPGIKVYRPADAFETEVCLRLILEGNIPAILALTRQPLSQLPIYDKRLEGIKKGAYIFECGKENTEVSIWATGSEVKIAIEVSEILHSKGVEASVISAPCIELFFLQDETYRVTLLCNTKLVVAIEAATKFGWERIIGMDGMFFGVEDFGISAPYYEVYEHFKITAQLIAAQIIEKYSQLDLVK